MSPALASRFFTTEPPGEPKSLVLRVQLGLVTSGSASQTLSALASLEGLGHNAGSHPPSSEFSRSGMGLKNFHFL